jgi:formate hydrogenlyase subunit 6/NADH:ubiquinone oxidoreductase subunit I/flavodoxin
MNPEIYYFTGTGNSIVVAKEISEKIDGEIISIASVIDKQKIEIKADIFGIVFPCYLAQLYGLPLIIERFIEKIENIKGKYIFAIITYGGYGPVNAIPTVNSLRKLISSNGGKLALGFSIKLPLNNLDYEHIPIPISQNREKMFMKCNQKIDKICRTIRKLKRRDSAIKIHIADVFSRFVQNILGSYVLESLKKNALEPQNSSLGFKQLIPLTDKSITVNDNCTGCGICSKICPVNNIRIENSKPIWLHRCEMCFACDEWCPQKAIHHWAKIIGKDYHHPKVNINYMLMQRNIR